MEKYSGVNKLHHNNWNKFLENSTVFVLTALILVFMLYPKTDKLFVSNLKYSEKPIKVIDIAQTRQIKLFKNPNIIKSPKVAIPVIQPIIEEIKLTQEEVKPIEKTEIVESQPIINSDYTEELPVDFEELSEIPKILKIGYKINYPKMARLAGIEGIVQIKALIDRDGIVIKTEMIKSIGGGCDEEALEYVKSLKFKPGTQREKPVKVWMMIPVKFSLK